MEFIALEGADFGYWLPEKKFCFLRSQQPFGETVLKGGQRQQIEELSETYRAEYMLLFCENHAEYCFCFWSSSRRIRALEFMDFLIPDFGLSKGDGNLAFGRIGKEALRLHMEELEQAEIAVFLQMRIQSYFTDVDWIEAEEYGLAHSGEHSSLPKYFKKKIAWAYVETTALAAPGEEIGFRTLENESGMKIRADKDRYLMVGSRGEIYDIAKEKFEASYEPTDEKLDLFAAMADNIPEVKLPGSNEYVCLDEIARICYPKPGSGIYAKELERRTKVFYKGGDGEYFLGNPGDYLAIRPDDLTDLYIIRRDIFKWTYEKK